MWMFSLTQARRRILPSHEQGKEEVLRLSASWKVSASSKICKQDFHRIGTEEASSRSYHVPCLSSYYVKVNFSASCVLMELE